ncbi:MAG: type II secretion system F family protein [Patescibacteria group bacterium]
MHFSYIAKKISGEEIKGVMDAKDKFDLARMLRQQDYFLVSCKEESGKKSLLHFRSLLGRVSISEKMFFSRNISIMISAGVSIARSLDILCRQTKNKSFKKIIISLADNIKKGNTLSESMKIYPKIFPPFFTAMVKVGEESGNLSESLRLIGEQLERDHTLRKKIKGALVYPAIIITAMVGIGILMLIYVVPTLVSTFQELGVDLPISTRIVIATSNSLLNYPLVFVAALFILASLLLFFFRSQKGRYLMSNILMRLPLFSSLVKKINSARTARTLSSLISAGVDILNALTITKDVLTNYKYQEVIQRARDDIQKGMPISESFKKASNVYPILVGEMMAVGEETGKLSEMLLRIAGFYEDEVAETTKNMSTIIEPILMVIIGAVVGFFAVSMIKPMYSMVNNM